MGINPSDTSPGTGDTALRPTALRVEYEQEPENVRGTAPGDRGERLSSTPRFSWGVSGPRGSEQSAYRIVVDEVSGSPRSPQPLWDSGVVASTRSVNVEYDGPPLEPNQTYQWHVRVYDDDAASEWSEPATFSTAIPGGSEYWQGSWIGPDYDAPDLVGREWADYTFTVTFAIETGTAGFVFRAGSTADLYAWEVSVSDDRTTDLGLLVREDGDWRCLDEIELDAPCDPVEVHRISIDVDGKTITTSFDGAEVDKRRDGTHAAGTVGFCHRGTDRVQIHDAQVVGRDGQTLLDDPFEAVPGTSFNGGVVRDGTLTIDGANDPSDVVLHSNRFDRPAPLLRHEFEVSKDVERARLHVAGLGFYELALNGERVGDRVLEPGQTDYEETILYSTFDVTALLEAGENAIGVTLGRGRYGELVPNVWYWDDAPWWGDPRLLVQFDIEYSDGTDTTVVTDENWKTTDGPTRFDSLFGGEVYDARMQRDGWTKPGYDDEEWLDASVVPAPDGELAPQRTPPITVSDTLDPTTVEKPESGVYVFDFGQVIAGWVELMVEGDEGTVVTLTLGEKRRDDGTVDVSNRATVGPIQTDQYVLCGDGTETWEPRFSYKGFRYVQIEGFPGEPTAAALTAKVVHTAIDANDDGQFSCSNELLTQIHKNTNWAFLNNHHSIPTDTPKYEKNGWTGDAQVTAETGLLNHSMERFYTKWLRDFRDAQRESGELPPIIPTSDWGYSDTDCSWEVIKGIVPETGMASILVPWWLYRYAGDTRVLERQYGSMTRYLQRLSDHADGHILRTGLGDWPDPVEGPAAVSTAYYYRGASVLSEVARLVGTERESNRFAALADDIADAFTREFYDAKAGHYRTGETDTHRQTSNCLPLAFDMVPAEYVDSVVESLVTDIVETRDGHLSTNVFGTKYLLPVLSERGHHDVAYQIATQTTEPSWGYWIANGHTSLLESWSLDARSVNHHFFGSVDEWFHKYLAGISIAKPGFRRVNIAPRPVADLQWVDASVDTVRGVVKSRWERESGDSVAASEDRLSLDVSIPGNTTASIAVPTLGTEQVRLSEGDTIIWDGDRPNSAARRGIDRVVRGDESVAVDVGSGEYRFELEPLGTP